MAVIPIKVACGSTLHRLSLPSTPPPTAAALLTAVAAPFHLTPADVAAATYVDDDGDEVTLATDADVAEALRVVAVLRVRLVVLPAAPPSAPPRRPRWRRRGGR
eukprot:TRINITY_DN1788_c0_g1_i1.p7 TRINITY_DN1788_c0_g1~~TRINITY_DN1788_c0_g1_i1.p7  ORF type:complete len:104 (+),score=39.45 TRINITY_DN1788_c0_g1_i1:163-474(+)